MISVSDVSRKNNNFCKKCFINLHNVVYDKEEEGRTMPFLSIATLIVSISFAIICIYIAKLILNISGLLKTVSESVDQVEQQLDSSIHETEQLLTTVEHTTSDVDAKLQALTPVFHSLNDIGIATSTVSETIEKNAKVLNEEEMRQKLTPFIRIIQAGEYGSSIMNAWKRGKKVTGQ